MDAANKLTATINFKYEETSTASAIANKMKGFFWKSEEKPPSDVIEVIITKETTGESETETKKEVVSQGSGSWLSFLQIDGEVYWKIDEPSDKDREWSDNIEKLPSDSTKREDAIYIKAGDYEKAQKEKDNLENLQRQDKKLRSSNPKPTTEAK